MNRISSISRFHQLLSLPAPLHPLVSVVHVEDIRFSRHAALASFALAFYTISIKRNVHAKMKYGQQYYDFDKGVMSFTAPGQIQFLDNTTSTPGEGLGTGYALLLHPDFLTGHPLAVSIKKDGFFSYRVNEALHLSEKEETDVITIIRKTEQELAHTDRHTHDIILSQLNLLLSYVNRFYERQFLTRKVVYHELLAKMEELLTDYFGNEDSLKNGLPTVEYIAGRLNLSPRYLSDMLRTLTGQSAQQHIHNQLVEKAKEYLTSTRLSVAEIAYRLGFERPQSFNKLFRKKTNGTPLQFRRSFN